MARYRILSWRGIPAQVKAFPETGRPVSALLPDWFQQEIDRVAMRDGLAGSDAYLEQWEWSADEERPGSADEVAAAVAAELDATWRDKREDGDE
jgi:hypothetical protein